MTTNVTRKLFTDTMGNTTANNYIGNAGEVFYDQDGSTPMRLSDGKTAGGIAFGIASVSTAFNPKFRSNTGNTLAGTVVTGSYVKQGLIVHFRVNVDFSNTVNFDTANNQYQFDLPFPSMATLTIRGGTLHQTTGQSLYHIAGVTDIANSNTLMNLYYSGSTTDLAWKHSTPVGATTNTSHFDISGAYETNSLAVI